MEQHGYILRDHVTKKYFVSSKLNDLANHARKDEWVETIAYPIMRRVGEQVMWPLSLVTLKGGLVVDLMNTDVESPYMTSPVARLTHHLIIGRAGAHVLLAGLIDEERDRLLTATKKQDPSIFSRAGLNPKTLKLLIEEIRRDGYGVFKMPGRNWAGLSAGVLVKDKISFALSMRFHPSAIETPEAVNQFLPLLNSGASELSESLSRQ